MAIGRTTATALSVLLLTTALAACGDADRETADAPVDTVAATPPPPAPPRPSVRGYPSQEGTPVGTVGTPGTGHNVTVTVNEWGVQLSPDSIDGGPVNLVIQNQGQRRHAVEVYSQHYGRWRSAAIPPGGSVTMSMPLQYTTYEVFCPMEDDQGNHKAKGMVAKLHVD